MKKIFLLILLIGVWCFVLTGIVDASEGEAVPTLDCPTNSASEGDSIDAEGEIRNNGTAEDDMYLVVIWVSESRAESGEVCSRTVRLDVGESISCSNQFTMPDENIWIYAAGYHKEGSSYIKDDSDGKWITLVGGPAPGPGPPPVVEPECPPGSICIDNPIASTTFEDLVNSIINFIFYLALAIAPIMFIIAGFTFITAAGDPAKIQKAKDIVLWTAIGLIVVLMATGIIKVIQEIFSG